MSVPVNVHMFKIMHTPIKVGINTYTMYANCFWGQDIVADA